jgi:myosin heavy subunit
MEIQVVLENISACIFRVVAKFLEVRSFFSQSSRCSLIASLSEYLLERGRLVRQTHMERNFHVFYYLLHGVLPEARVALRLYSTGQFRYLLANNETLDGDHCAERWREILEAFTIVGFTDILSATITRVLAGILHLGNVSFTDDDTATVADQAQLAFAAEMLLVGRAVSLPRPRLCHPFLLTSPQVHL